MQSVLWKATKLVRHNLPLVKPCWLPLIHLCVFHMLQHNFQKELFHNLTGHWEADWSIILRILIIALFKNGYYIPFSPVTEDFPWLPWLFRYDSKCLSNYTCQFPQDPGMHLIGSHGIVNVMVVSNMIFYYNGRDFVSPVPTLRFKDLILNKNWDEKSCWVPQLFPCLLSIILLSYILGAGYFFFFNLPFLTNFSCRNPHYYSSHSLPNSALAVP